MTTQDDGKGLYTALPVDRQRYGKDDQIMAVLYTDTINGEQTCRDDLWLATTTGLRDVYAEGRKDEAEAQGGSVDALLRRIEELEREKRELFCRFLGLLKELHDSEHLSEQQCAKYLGVDLLTWREESQGPYTPHPFEQENA